MTVIQRRPRSSFVTAAAVTAIAFTPLTGIGAATLASIECAPPSAHYSPGVSAEAPPAALLEPPTGVVELTATETRAAAATVQATSIAVWFHVITAGPGTDVTDDHIAKQLAILNDAFAGGQGGAASPFSFTHAGTDRTENAAWYGALEAGSPEERAMMTALRKGDATTLNVYVTKTTGASWARFPSWYRYDPALDGIVLTKGHFFGTADAFVTESNGVGAGAGLGDIAAHEVGHWLGLYHTFHGYDAKKGTGGCLVGDQVEDTPAEDVPATGCPVVADTCPAPGGDPVHNFMDYSDEVCMSEFTLGQVERMKAQWSTYRAGKSKPGRGNGRK